MSSRIPGLYDAFCSFVESYLCESYWMWRLLTAICSVNRVKDMYYHVNDRSGLKSPLIADDVYEIIMKV